MPRNGNVMRGAVHGWSGTVINGEGFHAGVVPAN